MYLTATNLILLALAGVGTGVLGAVLGTGGGVFLIPILVIGFGVPMHYAVATSILSVIATSSAVASANVERGTANMRLGMTLEVATALGAICGGISAAWMSPQTLEFVFAAVLLPTAILMWRGREDGSRKLAATVASNSSAIEGEASHTAIASSTSAAPNGTGVLGGSYFDPRLGRSIAYRVERLWAGLLVSFAAGNLSGLLGIGGGVFKVPALHLLCCVPIKAAAATSNFMIGVTAAASGFLYYGRGEVRPALTAVVVLGVLAGSAIGTWLNRFLAGESVRRMFAVILALVAVQMFLRSWTE